VDVALGGGSGVSTRCTKNPSKRAYRKPKATRLDTTTPAGKAMFQLMVFAEFERAMIAERVRAGLARARSEGKCLGRRFF
jgi:DNA invertase Pin-like site-specific DNA recombinase